MEVQTVYYRRKFVAPGGNMSGFDFIVVACVITACTKWRRLMFQGAAYELMKPWFWNVFMFFIADELIL